MVVALRHGGEEVAWWKCGDGVKKSGGWLYRSREERDIGSKAGVALQATPRWATGGE